MTPCDVGRWVTLHFRYPPGGFRPPVSGVVTIVRWQRDAQGTLHVLVTLEVTPRQVREYEIERSSLSRITVDGSDRSML